MSLSVLPAEVILAIATYLAPRQLLAFAHVNSFTYHTLYTQLLPILKHFHNRFTIIQRFGQPQIGSELNDVDAISEIYDNTELSEKFVDPVNGTLPDLEYLNLNGDLHWLHPIPSWLDEFDDWARGQAATEVHMAKLLQQAKDVDVEIPPVFLKFICNQTFIHNMCPVSGRFSLRDKLIKCQAAEDSNGGGFMLTFFHDVNRFLVLYLAPGGFHGVLETMHDPHLCTKRNMPAMQGKADEDEVSAKHARLDVDQGKPIVCSACQGVLKHTNFEEWLCREYFDDWIMISWLLYTNVGGTRRTEVDEEKWKLTPKQLEYLEHYWVRKSDNGMELKSEVT